MKVFALPVLFIKFASCSETHNNLLAQFPCWVSLVEKENMSETNRNCA